MTDWTDLLRHRWMIPALAVLQRWDGAKFVTLVHDLGANRSAVRAALEALVGLGLVERNPGYGHPLRPEYILTGSGSRVAGCCVDLAEAVDTIGAGDVAYRKWSLPVVLQLAEGADRFGELEATIEGVTPRALSLALKQLVAAGLVERAVEEGYPPVSRYRLTEASVALLSPLRQLVAAAEV